MIRTTFNMAACTADEDSDDAVQSSLSVKLNTSFTVKDLITVLNRIASSEIKAEAEFAAKILGNTFEKECLEPLYCFVSSLVEAFRGFSYRASKVKSENLRAIK